MDLMETRTERNEEILFIKKTHMAIQPTVISGNLQK